jgi:hypothetical protein
MRLRRRARVFLGVVVVIALVVPYPKLIVRKWSVRVVDSIGNPVSGVRVTQSWEHYTFLLSGGGEAMTDSTGTVTFPNQRSFQPVISLLARAVANVVGTGVHAGFGTSGYVSIVDHRISRSGLTDMENSLMSANCSGKRCLSGELESRLQIPSRGIGGTDH